VIGRRARTGKGPAAMSSLSYRCCDCGSNVAVDGLEAVPDPPRCLCCHLIALQPHDVREWLRTTQRQMTADRPTPLFSVPARRMTSQ
jgi:hypothetical protein